MGKSSLVLYFFTELRIGWLILLANIGESLLERGSCLAAKKDIEDVGVVSVSLIDTKLLISGERNAKLEEYAISTLAAAFIVKVRAAHSASELLKVVIFHV